MYKKENGQKERNVQKQRYNDKNYDRLQAYVTQGYAVKLEYIADTLHISKAKALEKCIDTLYSELWLD